MKQTERKKKALQILGGMLLFFLLFSYVPAMKVKAEENTGNTLLDSYETQLNASTDPWDILSGRSGVGYGIVSIGGDRFTISVYQILRNMVIVVCLIGVMMSLISIPFISNSAALKEKKEELTHKALTFAASFAVVPILNFIKAVLDNQFGL